MELRHLRYFQTVAETLNFSHAAERLRIAQSAISRQIAALEQELGVQLFVRSTTRVRLTDAGRHLHKEVDRLLAQLAIAVTGTQEIAHGRGGELNLASDWRVLFPQIPEAVVRYRETHPRVTVNLVELPLHDQVEALREGRIHIGFVPKPLVPTQPELESMFLFKTDMKVIISAHHPLAGENAVSLRTLSKESWIKLDEKNNPGYRTIMIQLCHPALFTPRFGRVAESIDGMLALVAMNEGICLLPTSLISRQHPGLRFLESDCPPFEFYAIWQKNDPTELPAGFLAALRKTL
ncbi:MAG: LysR substrate-binding domain-containing protein [Opitutaceae bacterium]|jgi:DNA-binding transcriptional LysR family regulator